MKGWDLALELGGLADRWTTCFCRGSPSTMGPQPTFQVEGSRLSQHFGHRTCNTVKSQDFPAPISHDLSFPRHNIILISWQNVDKRTRFLCFGSLASQIQKAH